MALTIQVIRGSTTYNISAGQPISLADVDDLGGASVSNQEERGPYQDGSSHLDFRLEPRTFTLRLNVVGSTAAALDGYRDTLNAMFKPVRGVPIILKITRDDGEIRQIECQRTGPLAIPLRPQDHAGKLHRAVVQLRAADPTFYDPVIEEGTFVVPSDWYLGYNTIGTANVLEQVQLPGTAQLWANTGTVAAGSAWSIVFRSGSVTPGAGAWAWGVSNFFYFGAFTGYTGGYELRGNNEASPLVISGALMSAGTANYMAIYEGGTVSLYRDNVLIGQDTGDPPGAIPATTGRWRSYHTGAGTWVQALPFAAVYNIALNSTQRSALHQIMSDLDTAFNTTFVYEGDWDSYPLITITGPIANPIITNTATGDVLDFTGGTVGSVDIWTIDTARYGYKSVLNVAGSSVEQYLSNDSDLATFRIVPDPIATGGTNVITMSGLATSGSTEVNISYYTRFMDY